MSAEPRRLGAVERFIGYTEKAAGIFLAAVTVLVFVNVMMRGVSTGLSRSLIWITGDEAWRFVATIPEWFHLSCLMLGICVFWGIAVTSYRNDHIKVDILWEWATPSGKRAIDLFATGVMFLFMLVFCYMLAVKVRSGFYSHEATYDLRLKLWPFHLVMTVGIYFCAVLVGIRFWQLLRGERVERGDQISYVE